MPQILIEILLTALGTIVTGLVGWGVKAFCTWMSTKTKDMKFNGFMSQLITLTGNAVKETYQTYVESIKAQGKFDKKAQEKALAMCVDKLKNQLTSDLLDFIGKNFGDVTNYLKSLIETSIYNLKNIETK